MEIFKGYLPTKDKKSLVKFADYKSYDEVKNLKEYAGLLADDIILIDIDSSEQSELLMKIIEGEQIGCKVLETTRGKHFYFVNSSIDKNFTGTKLVCGISSDIKVGCKNSYAIQKSNNQERFVEWDYEPYSELPKWLFPINTSTDLLNLKEGDGRNQTLFNYILELNSMGFSKDDARTCLKIINKYIFETPLSDDEIETITRDDAFPVDTFFTKKGGFLHDKFAQYLINENHIKRIDGQLHIFRNNEYIAGARFIENSMLKNIPSLKSQQRGEVLKYIENIVVEESKMSPPNLISFSNGILDIDTGLISKHSPEIIIRNNIKYDYNPNAYSKIADDTLNKIACNDFSVRRLLEECIGYGLYRRNELSKAFILTGEKANGKSTFLDSLLNLYGDENISTLDISELDERFSVAELSGKLVNIGDDISDEFLAGRSIATFKKIVSGNSIKAEYKGEDVFFFKPYCKLFFSANEIPRMKDKTGAVLRRLVIIPFNARFSKADADYDPYIVSKLKTKEVMEYYIKIGIEGLKRVLENKSFSDSQKVEKAIEQYEIDNNPILSFIRDVEVDNIVNQSTDDVYRRYRLFCIENGFKEMTKSMFSREIKRKADIDIKVSWLNGKNYRIFIKV